MIFQAKATFFIRDSLIFLRSQDKAQIVQGKQIEIFVSFHQNQIVFLKNQESPLCKFYYDAFTVQISELTAKFAFSSNKKNDNPDSPILTITSSKQFIDELAKRTQQRKYKTCLSFTPSTQPHISILSGQSHTQKFRGFMNLGAVMFVILNIRNIIDNFLKYGAQFNNAPFEFIPISVILGFLFIFFFPLLAYILAKLKFNGKMNAELSNSLSIVNIVMVAFYNIQFCKYFEPQPLPGIFLTSFCMVVILKLISYYQVNNQIYTVLQKMNEAETQQQQRYIFGNHQISESCFRIISESKTKLASLISIRALFYFLAAPTLCYQLEYPRTSSIRKSWLVKRCIEFTLMTGLQLIIFLQYIQPELYRWFNQMESGSYTSLSVIHRLSIPNTLMWISGFYNFFHLLLNISAQLLRFGDRKFYEDWWNCKTLEEYWKLWNLPVHFWFIRHVYNPLLARKWTKNQANLFVFFVSAIGHEFIVSVPLQILSYYAFLGMLLQAPAIFIQRKMDKILHLTNSELGNVSFWVFFCILGQPMVVFIYYSLYMVELSKATMIV